MKVSFPVKFGKPAYQVEFRPNGYHIDGKRVKRVSTIVDRFPDSGEGLLNWAKERVAITAGRLLRDRVVAHPVTGKMVCYFPADQIPLITTTAYQNPDEIKNETAETGTAVHFLIDEWLKGGATEARRKAICSNYMLTKDADLLEVLKVQDLTKEMPDTERNLFYDTMKSYMFNRFCAFWKESGLAYVASELVVGSRKHKFGGRIDILARDKKKRYVLPDFKTSKWVGPSMFAQVAGYKIAIEEMLKIKIRKTCIIQCPREWTDRNQGFGVYSFNPAPYERIFLDIIRDWNYTTFKAADCRKEYLP